MPQKHYPKRKSPRLKGYDYSQSGAYFVTICTHDRIHLFGEIVNEKMLLSDVGEITQREIGKISGYWPGLVDMDLYVVMPNHIHMIVALVETVFLPSEKVRTDTQKQTDTQKRVPTLGRVVGNYKAGVTRRARQQGYIDDNAPIWQGRYHDHVIRSEESLNKIREYVLYNPGLWEKDTFYVP